MCIAKEWLSDLLIFVYIYTVVCMRVRVLMVTLRGGGLESRPKQMYGEKFGDGVEYHLMSPTPRCC